MSLQHSQTLTCRLPLWEAPNNNRSEESTTVFETLKRAMILVSIPTLPNFALPFVVETDASEYGLGDVLTQNSRSIAFFGQKLSPRAQTKAIYER